MAPLTILLLLLLGAVAGYVSGLVGIGGGIIIVPGLMYLLQLTQQSAQGTTLAMLLLPIGIMAVWVYWQKGLVDWSAALLLGAGYIIGSWKGADMAVRLPTAELKRVFAVLLFVMGCKLLWDAQHS